MRTSGIFETHRFEIKDVRHKETIYVIPFGDVHKFSPMHDKRHWADFLKWAAEKKNAYFLGMGDYCDIGSASERKILKSPELHESTQSTLDDLYLSQAAAFVDDIKFMRGRLIGMIGGNHDAVMQSGISMTQKMCDMLGCKFLGVAALIRLRLRTAKVNGGTTTSLDIFAHHGKGSGLLVGSGLNAIEKMEGIAEADIYLMGDNHQKALAYTDKLYLSETKEHTVVKKKKKLYARTGSFMQGYKQGVASYVTDKLLKPLNLGTIKIELTYENYRDPEISKFSTHRVNLHASL